MAGHEEQSPTSWPASCWFQGGGWTPFLERVRGLAPERLGHVIEPDRTWETEYAGRLLSVDVLDGGGSVTIQIQVRWDDGFLAGYWGDAYLWDDFDERDDEALVVRGLLMTDEAAAEAAVAWLARQLSRPLDHQVWENGRTVAQRWVLTDTGREVGRHGNRRARRTAPSCVTRLRPSGR